jgi:ribosomal protein S18 acetylase RimI-like enzyme
MTEIEVRPARPEEFEAVGELTAAAYLADGLVRQEYLPALRDAPGRAAAGTLMVAADAATGDLLGTASLFTANAGPSWAEGASPGDAVLRMLGVSPRARRRGVARALTLECIHRAQQMGLHRLILSTAPAMTAARALYEQLGFRRDPGADWEPVPGVSLLAYWLPLQERAGR